jgi:hypothetical protein
MATEIWACYLALLDAVSLDDDAPGWKTFSEEERNKWRNKAREQIEKELKKKSD